MLSGRFGPLNKKKTKFSQLVPLVLFSEFWISDTDSALFFSSLQDANKNMFFSAYLLTLGTFTSASKDKKSFRSHKTVEITVFLNLLVVDGRVRILKARKLTDPWDPDRNTFSDNVDNTTFWQKDKKNAEIQEIYKNY
jgi:hypothetical protein